MMSGVLIPTYGVLGVNGHSFQELDEIRKSIGFCPQFDAIIPKLSGRAHLELFAELRGT
jgi:ABC-type multidrug transport system ATPase subunit